VVNPPAANKYCHWVNEKLPRKPEQWLETATQKPGSWWPLWDEWAKGYGGGTVPVRTPGDGKLAVIEAAPGSYVKVKAQ
jgi:polyhydroxyalkanoate synthase